MKNTYLSISIALFVFIFFVGSHTVQASWLTKILHRGFGGKITNIRATRVRNQESMGYKCIVPGTAIDIKPVGSYPTSYVIPSGVRSKTNTTPTVGQSILGNYTPTVTSISCTDEKYPYDVVTLTLPTIEMYGTSK